MRSEMYSGGVKDHFFITLFVCFLLAILVCCWSRYIYIGGSNNKQQSYRGQNCIDKLFRHLYRFGPVAIYSDGRKVVKK